MATQQLVGLISFGEAKTQAGDSPELPSKQEPLKKKKGKTESLIKRKAKKAPKNKIKNDWRLKKSKLLTLINAAKHIKMQKIKKI